MVATEIRLLLVRLVGEIVAAVLQRPLFLELAWSKDTTDAEAMAQSFSHIAGVVVKL